MTSSSKQIVDLDKPYSMLVGSASIGGFLLTTVFLKQSPFGLKDWMAETTDGSSIMYDGLFLIVPFSDWKGDYLRLAKHAVCLGSTNAPVLTHAGKGGIFLEWHPQTGHDTKLLRILYRVGTDFQELHFPDYTGAFFYFSVNEPPYGGKGEDKKMTLSEIQKEAESKPTERCIFTLPLEYMQFERCFGCILDLKDGLHAESFRAMGGYLEVETSGRWYFYGCPAPNVAPDFKKIFAQGQFHANGSCAFRVTFAGTWKSVLHILENYYQRTNQQA